MPIQQVAKVPRIDTSPEIIRYLQRIAEGGSSISFPLSKSLVIPDINIRNPGEIPTVVSGWPAANRAIYIPFSIPASITVDTIGIEIGNVGGNIDYGIYSEVGAALFRNGGHAVTVDTFDAVTSTTALRAGLYYLGISAASATIRVGRVTTSALGNSVNGMTGIGVRQQASAYPLPSTAVFATPASAFLPIAAISISRVT